MYRRNFLKKFFKPNQDKINFKMCLAVHDLVILYNTICGLHHTRQEKTYEH